MENFKHKRIIDLTVQELLDCLDKRYLSPPKTDSHSYDKKPFLKVKECAALTGYTEDYIRQLVFKRKIPFTKLNNGSLRFISKDIAEWVQNSRRLSLPDEAQRYIEQ